MSRAELTQFWARLRADAPDPSTAPPSGVASWYGEVWSPQHTRAYVQARLEQFEARIRRIVTPEHPPLRIYQASPDDIAASDVFAHAPSLRDGHLVGLSVPWTGAGGSGAGPGSGGVATAGARRDSVHPASGAGGEAGSPLAATRLTFDGIDDHGSPGHGNVEVGGADNEGRQAGLASVGDSGAAGERGGAEHGSAFAVDDDADDDDAWLSGSHAYSRRSAADLMSSSAPMSSVPGVRPAGANVRGSGQHPLATSGRSASIYSGVRPSPAGSKMSVASLRFTGVPQMSHVQLHHRDIATQYSPHGSQRVADEQPPVQHQQQQQQQHDPWQRHQQQHQQPDSAATLATDSEGSSSQDESGGDLAAPAPPLQNQKLARLLADMDRRVSRLSVRCDRRYAHADDATRTGSASRHDDGGDARTGGGGGSDGDGTGHLDSHDRRHSPVVPVEGVVGVSPPSRRTSLDSVAAQLDGIRARAAVLAGNASPDSGPASGEVAALRREVRRLHAAVQGVLDGRSALPSRRQSSVDVPRHERSQSRVRGVPAADVVAVAVSSCRGVVANLARRIAKHVAVDGSGYVSDDEDVDAELAAEIEQLNAIADRRRRAW